MATGDDSGPGRLLSMSARIVLLVTSPRLPAGLLTAAAWDVYGPPRCSPARRAPQPRRCARPGVEVTVVTGRATDALLAAAAGDGTAVWLAGPAGDEALARELGLRLARAAGPGRAGADVRLVGSAGRPAAGRGRR